MKNKITKSTTDGSITVFLSLILILILSLLLIIIEGARVNTAKIYAERALSTGMDSVLAEYYAPLWKEYHLFGLDTGYGSKTPDKEEMLLKLQDYMSYTFQPNIDHNSLIGKEGLELYGVSVKKITEDNNTMLMDYQGKLFMNQAVEYMKYEDLSDAAEIFLNKLSMLQSPKKVSYLYEEKQKVSEELVEIDEGILELMELLDGINTSRKGISLNKDHTLKTVPYFVKKICIGDVTREKTEINQENVFLALKDNYIDPTEKLNQIDSKFIKLTELQTDIELAKQNYDKIVSDIEAANRALAGLSSSENPSKETMEMARQIYLYIGSLSEQLNSIHNQIRQDGKEIDKCLESMEFEMNMLMNLSISIKPKIENAISVIDRINSKIGLADQLIKGYEDKLYKEKDGMESELFANLVSELKDMKRYTSEGEDGYHFSKMKEILNKDLDSINQALEKIYLGGQYLNQKNYYSSRGCFKAAASVFSTYQIKGLRLDYSTLILSKDEELNPINKIGNCIQDGFVGLIMDSDTISKKELITGTLPSEINALYNGEENLFNFSSFLEKCKLGNKDAGTGNFFGSAGKETDVMKVLGKGINELTKDYLFQDYLKECFMTYEKEGENLKTRKPAALSYEQEYLLYGKPSDKENISAVISKVILIRSILNFVSLLKDKVKYNEAKAAAAALVGFSGLPILVNVTQMLILLIWALAESLVDTSALMMGKEIEIFKKTTVLNFTDLFLLNRTFIQKKANQMVSTQGSNTKLLTLSYQDYLRIFLILKKKETLAYRSMDIIQENIRLRYDENFTFQNCLFGFKVSADFIIPSKFIALPFIQKYTGKVRGYRYHTQSAYSY